VICEDGYNKRLKHALILSCINCMWINYWVDRGIDGRIILRWLFRMWSVGVWTGLGWPRIEKGGGHL
jgi:hypothetical protein